MIIGVQRNLQKVGFDNFFECLPRGKSGGLALSWKQGVALDISFANNHIMNVALLFDPRNHPWMLSFVYGPNDCNEKFSFWYNLEEVGNSFAGAWLCPGDFNALLNPSDKKGGRPFSGSSPNGFLSFMLNTGLVDVGNPFTWSNGRYG